MKKKKFINKLIIILVPLILLSIINVYAAVDASLEESNAAALVKLQLMKGDENGNLKLQDKVSRCEFTTLVIRMLGKEGDTALDSVKNEFPDVSQKHWAYNNIRIGVKYGLINGYEDKSFRPDNNVNYTEARAIIVRALGYEPYLAGKWPENVINKSKEIGLEHNIDVPDDKEITRGEATILIYNSLTIPYSN
jgi:hypothetical protein